MKRKPRQPLSIAARIRAAREAAGLSLQAASTLAGVSMQTWHRWEREKSAPTLKHLQAVADALRIGIDILIAQ
jgi:transcriptional regulator with XRE-family HTH domain